MLRMETKKPTKTKLVESSPNAIARDAAVALLKGALDCGPSDRVCNQIRAALVCLEVIS